MDELSSRTKKFILSKGAHIVGIAPINRFDQAPHGHKPQDILSDARSVIVFANRNPDSIVMDGPATSYHHMMITFYNKLDLIANETANYLEEQGIAAIPIPSDDPYFDWNPDKAHGRGDLSHKHAAQAAGIGKLGKNSLLITPEFGNRVQLVSMVTNADLEPDPEIKSELCPAECTLCLKACPVSAIKEGQVVNQKLCRSYMFLELPKGQKIYGCRECRKACTLPTQIFSYRNTAINLY